MTRQIPGYKFITALCPNLKPTWSKYRCQGSDRLDTVYSQASYRRDTVYSNSKGSEPGSPSYCRRKSFSEVQFQSLGVANSGNRPIQETRQWRHWCFGIRWSLSSITHCRSHSGITECTDAFLHPPTTQEMLSTRIFEGSGSADKTHHVVKSRRSDYKQSDLNIPTALDCQFLNTMTINSGFDLWVSCDSSFAVD